MSLYAYCLCEEPAGAAVEGARGVAGVEVRVVKVGRLWAVVSEFEGDAVPVTPESVRAHNLVNSRVLARTTPLPFRFGTLADEARLAAYAGTNEVTLTAALARVRGRVEMGVKIMRAAPAGRAVGKGEGGAGSEALGSGTAFLLAKRRELLGDEAARAKAEEIAAWLAGRVSDLARESSVRVSPAQALVVRAAHLLEPARVGEYRARVRAAAEERPDLRFLTSGPWPPYSFSELRDERAGRVDESATVINPPSSDPSPQTS